MPDPTAHDIAQLAKSLAPTALGLATDLVTAYREIVTDRPDPVRGVGKHSAICD